MPGPLSGIKIVDLTAMASGPFATALLADQGADVVKVEPPGTGDLIRHIGSTRGGVSAIFVNMNRNKRSLVLDLKDERGRALLLRLAARADVLVQNFRPGTVDRMGIGESVVRGENPDLIYVSISGFGERGPDVQRKVYDSVMQASAGFAAHQADPQTGEPRFVSNIVCDKSTALTAAQAITAALLARERGHGGQHLRISMLHASLAFLWPDGMQNHTFIAAQDERAPASAPGSAAPSRSAPLSAPPPPETMRRATLPAIRRTADGYVSITTVTDREFRGLCAALALPELADDPRFAQAGPRARNSDALHETLAPAIAAIPSASLLERLARAEVPHAAITPLDELPEHPAVVANELLVEQVHPTAGAMRAVRPVGDFERTPSSLRLPAPALGEHSDEILAELGVSAVERTELRKAGVIA